MPPDNANDPLAPAAAVAAAPEDFRKLPGRSPTIRLRAAGLTSLYLASTYLLQIEVISYRESYMRFAYKDIQAIELTRTPRGLIYNAIIGVIAGLFLVPTVASLRDPVAPWVWGFFTGFCLTLLLINTLRGTTCSCFVQTAAGKQTLRSLARMRPARRAIAQIAQRVHAVQGALDQPEAARRMEEFLRRRAVQLSQRPQRAVAGTST